MMTSAAALAPRPASSHEVQFYSDDHALAGVVASSIRAGLANGHGAIVIATPEHRAQVAARLGGDGVDVAALTASGQLIMADAAATLALFMDVDRPDAIRFARSVGALVTDACRRFHGITAYGEMVDLLTAAGDHESTRVLETLWTSLLAGLPVQLLCGYRMDRFDRGDAVTPFRHVCDAHTAIHLDGEDPSEKWTPAQRRVVAGLRQQARALRGEADERQRAERELQDFFDHAVVGFHWVAGDGTILRANQAELDLLGYAADEYVGRSITEFHVDAENIADMLRRLGRGESLRNHRARLRRKDGAIRHVVIDSNVMWEGGRFVHTRCLTRDITDQVVAEHAAARRLEELIRSNAELEQFAQISSHDLKEPLRVVTQYATLLTMKHVAGLSEQGRRCVAHICDGATRATRVIDDLLTYTRLAGGEPATPVAVDEVVREVMSTLGDDIPRFGATFRVDVLPVVSFARTKLLQLFQHLIANALKFRSAQPPSVRISATRAGANWIFSVGDNGIGIDPRHHQRIFDLFQRLNPREDHDGSGIGLPICSKIVAQAGGRIWVESEAGSGATFRFTIRA